MVKTLTRWSDLLHASNSLLSCTSSSYKFIPPSPLLSPYPRLLPFSTHVQNPVPCSGSSSPHPLHFPTPPLLISPLRVGAVKGRAFLPLHLPSYPLSAAPLLPGCLLKALTISPLPPPPPLLLLEYLLHKLIYSTLPVPLTLPTHSLPNLPQ